MDWVGRNLKCTIILFFSVSVSRGLLLVEVIDESSVIFNEIDPKLGEN